LVEKVSSVPLKGLLAQILARRVKPVLGGDAQGVPAAAVPARQATEPPPPAAGPTPEAKAEADRLLAGLRAHVARVRADKESPPVLQTLAADVLAIGEGYVRNWGLEVSRGWDPLSLLRDLRRTAEDVFGRAVPRRSVLIGRAWSGYGPGPTPGAK
jgi:hypothetical protein